MSYITDSANQPNMYCGFYPSINGDRKYGNSDFGKFLNGIICDGVFLTIYNQFKVSPSDPIGTGVIVDTGKAWFNGTWIELTEPYRVECGEPYAGGYRCDTIVIAINTTDAEYTYRSVPLPPRDTTIVCIHGNTSQSDNASSVIRAGNQEVSTGVYLYPLADIYRVKGFANIDRSDIRIRVGDTACPYVETLLTPSNNATAFTEMWRGQLDKLIDKMHTEWDSMKNKFNGSLSTFLEGKMVEVEDKKDEVDEMIRGEEAKIESWFNGMRNVLGKDEMVAVNLQSQINANEIKNILRSGLSECNTTISPDGSIIESVSPDGMKLTKTFTNEFKTITTVLTNVSNVELGKLIIDISSDGSTIESALTTLY